MLIMIKKGSNQGITELISKSKKEEKSNDPE